jgi:phospholipid-transporting ATPase
LDNSEVDNIIEYCNILGLCHSVQVDPDKTTGELVYKAASPDEEALCKGAAHNGFVFKGREGGVIVLDVLGKETRYDLLCEMEFTSDRRRMSVIVRAPDGSIKVYSKGADSMIAERLAGAFDETFGFVFHLSNHFRVDTPENKQLLEETYAHLERFSVRGLRTLLLAQKPLTEDFWENWRREWNRAANLIDGREEAVRQSSAV